MYALEDLEAWAASRRCDSTPDISWKGAGAGRWIARNYDLEIGRALAYSPAPLLSA
jgi:hypothetical protein